MLDLVQWMVLPYPKRLEGGWEASAFDVLDEKNGRIWRLKKPDGARWDCWRFSDSGDFIRDWITEIDDGSGISTPRSYKKNVNNTPDGKDGVPMFPRFLQDNFRYIEVFTPGPYTTSIWYKDCKEVSRHSLKAGKRHTLSGPYSINHGGDIGIVDTLIHHFFWASTREENMFAKNWGRVRWSQAYLAYGEYVETRAPSIHNRYVKCKVPAVNCPCLV